MTDPPEISNPPAKVEPPAPLKERSKLRRRTVRGLKIFLVVVAIWFLAAYLILPLVWRHYEHQPKLADAPKTTRTAQGIPGDPLNVGLIGTEKEVVSAMLAAGWSPADPITLRSSLRIAASVAFRRPDADAPVSNLFLFGRHQDLAFEKPVGRSAKQRHHVRFWKSDELGREGVPLFIGSVTFDRSVGFSHTTGQITHHIGPNIDAERNGLIANLVAIDRLTRIYQVTGVGATLNGHNGGGDRYFTDGELTIGMLATKTNEVSRPERLPNPPLVKLKDQLWTAIGPFLSDSDQ